MLPATPPRALADRSLLAQLSTGDEIRGVLQSEELGRAFRIMIETENLLLFPAEPELFLALIEGGEEFREAFGRIAAAGLREFIVSDDVQPAFLARLRESSGSDPWQWGFFVIHRSSEEVIGCAGFKGAPDPDGMVEIAYGIVASYENKGYATIAARQLVAFARRDPRVRCIRAHTLPTPNASTRVLEKNGFQRIGTINDPEEGVIWRWEHV